MKLGDAVLFTEFGKVYDAIVLKIRHLDDHYGSSDEPLVDLGFFKLPEDKDGNLMPVSGTTALEKITHFRHDVAHKSHSYTEKQQLAYGMKVYPGGRWEEIEISSFTGSVTEENPTEAGGENPAQLTDGGGGETVN